MKKQTKNLVTRELQGTVEDAGQRAVLEKIFKITLKMRTDIWQQFGALGTIGTVLKDGKNKKKTARNLETLTTRKNPIISNGFRPDGLYSTIEQATFHDCINDIIANNEAGKTAIKKLIYKHYQDEKARHAAFLALKTNDYLHIPYVHKQMRKQVPHGKVTDGNNNFCTTSAGYTTEIVDGILYIIITNAKKHGGNIRIKTTSSGKNVNLNSNIRIMGTPDNVRILYTIEKTARATKPAMVGIDKGYTEVFVDSNGHFYGKGFGDILTEFAECLRAFRKNKNRLASLERKYREEGNIKKADNIRKNNLGKKAEQKLYKRFQDKLKNIIAVACHELCEKYDNIVVEALTFVSTRKRSFGHKSNNRINTWCKGTLQAMLTTIAKQHGCILHMVNAAFTSRIDNKTGLLPTVGKGRVSPKFHHDDGTNSHDDVNAAKNILARRVDKDITLYTTKIDVKKILIDRAKKP